MLRGSFAIGLLHSVIEAKTLIWALHKKHAPIKDSTSHLPDLLCDWLKSRSHACLKSDSNVRQAVWIQQNINAVAEARRHQSPN